MGNEEEMLEYITCLKDLSVPFYIELFRLSKKCLKFYSNFVFVISM